MFIFINASFSNSALFKKIVQAYKQMYMFAQYGAVFSYFIW